MNTRANLDKPLKPSKAAARLSIAVGDLPKLSRPWTRRDVHRLRKERPSWLTAARREHGAARQRAFEAKERQIVEQLVPLNAALDSAGYTRHDDGSEGISQYAEEALFFLLGKGAIHEDAELCVGRRWPTWLEDPDDNGAWW